MAGVTTGGGGGGFSSLIPGYLFKSSCTCVQPIVEIKEDICFGDYDKVLLCGSPKMTYHHP